MSVNIHKKMFDMKIKRPLYLVHHSLAQENCAARTNHFKLLVTGLCVMVSFEYILRHGGVLLGCCVELQST